MLKIEINLEGGNTFFDELGKAILDTLESRVPGELYCCVETAKALFWKTGFSVNDGRWISNFYSIVINIVDEFEVESGSVKYIVSPPEGKNVEYVFTHVTSENII